MLVGLVGSSAYNVLGWSFIPRGARFGANPGSLVQMGGS